MNQCGAPPKPWRPHTPLPSPLPPYSPRTCSCSLASSVQRLALQPTRLRAAACCMQCRSEEHGTSSSTRSYAEASARPQNLSASCPVTRTHGAGPPAPGGPRLWYVLAGR